MSARRERFLEEMGLTPVWRLRNRAAGDDRTQGANAAEEEQAAPAKSQAPADAQGPADAPDREARIARMDWSELKAKVGACSDCGLRKSCT